MGKGAGRWEVDMVKNRDTEIRLCAFSRLDVLIQIHGTSVPWSSIAQGFHVGSESILFATTVEGIFKPRQMDQVLSIKTVVPKPGGKVWYQDQIRDEQIASPEEIFCYSFKGTDPDDPKNRLLERAMILNLPLIYFYGINRPGAAPHYHPIYPVFIVGWNPHSLSCSVAVGARPQEGSHFLSPAVGERQYRMVETKHRLHQALFRERVINAYDGRCALTGLPELKLVDAAHIIPDSEKELGQPDIRNGICMSKIHHAAFDSQLIGIDPDYRIHVAHSLLDLHDGPMLEQGLKALEGKKILLPRHKELWPDRERLEIRYETFRQCS